MNTSSIPSHEYSVDDLLRYDCHPVPIIVYMILHRALRDRASDVYFEPQQSSYQVNCRVNGNLYDMNPLPGHLRGAVSQRFKVLAELDICDSRTIQVGRMQFIVGEGTAEMSVAFKPTEHGEAIHVTIDANSITNDELDKVLSEWDQKRAAQQPFEPFYPWFRWVLKALGVVKR